MAHFPFIDTLWLGEGFDLGPAVSKEHWLIEQSGILWGQFSEMLAGPNPYKGMLFGETGRAPLVNMKALYELWDMVHIDDMCICGWWNTSALGCPAHTSDTERVPLTTYHCPRCGQSGGPAALLSLASFAPVKLNVSLNINWPRLGFDASESVLTAPAVAGLQPLRTFQLDEAIPVAPSQGWLLVVTAKTLAKCGTVLANTDLSGHDLAPACAVHASSGSECCHKCLNATAAGCKAWTFISATQQCCLKVSALGRRSLPGHESGCVDAACNLPPPPPPPPPPPAAAAAAAAAAAGGCRGPNPQPPPSPPPASEPPPASAETTSVAAVTSSSSPPVAAAAAASAAVRAASSAAQALPSPQRGAPASPLARGGGGGGCDGGDAPRGRAAW
jgi:hypothetical protein